MQNKLFAKTRGTAGLILVILTVLNCSTRVLHAQAHITQNPTCFNITNPARNLNGCTGGNCSETGDPCSGNVCYDVSIYSCNNDPGGEDPDSFFITADDGATPPHAVCFNVCSSVFNVESSDAGCGQAPKVPNWMSSTHMSTTNGGSITICAPAGSVIHIQLDHHTGTLCSAPNPCTEAIIQF